MANDVKVTDLIINEMTEEQLTELNDAGTVPPNQIFLTDNDDEQGNLPLGMIIPVSVMTDDARLHLLDGSSLAQSGIYSQFCTWLKNRVLANSSNVPTCTIAEYATEMSTYGQCGKFVINDTSEAQISGSYRVEANSIKLPTIIKFIEGLNDVSAIGKAMEAGLPNITGQLGSTVFTVAGTTYGAFEQNWYGSPGVANGSWADTAYINIDASRSSNVYGKSDTVQPQSIRYPYYIVVATSVKTDVEVDIDNVTSDINVINSRLEALEMEMEDIWSGNIASVGTAITLPTDLSNIEVIQLIFITDDKYRDYHTIKNSNLYGDLNFVTRNGNVVINFNEPQILKVVEVNGRANWLFVNIWRRS